MEAVHVLVTDVNITKVLLVEHITLRQSAQKLVALIQFVLVVFTDVVQENVMVAKDVLPTLMVTI